MDSVGELLAPLTDVDDRGIHAEDGWVSWREHIRAGAAIGAALHARLDPARPLHVGVLLGNTPFFSSVLVAAAMRGLVKRSTSSLTALSCTTTSESTETMISASASRTEQM